MALGYCREHGLLIECGISRKLNNAFVPLVPETKNLEDLSAAMQSLKAVDLHLRCKKKRPAFFPPRKLEELLPVAFVAVIYLKHIKQINWASENGI